MLSTKQYICLDSGKARVAEQKGVGDWQVNEWLKEGCPYFHLDSQIMSPMPSGFTQYFDKVPSKYADTTLKGISSIQALG